MVITAAVAAMHSAAHEERERVSETECGRERDRVRKVAEGESW